MFCTIISDCRDGNASARQATRVASLFGSDINVITTIGVSTELEAAGNLVDVLDAAQGACGIVLVNVAPRVQGETRGWSNGAPFGYFFFSKTMVISSIGGHTLSLVKKLDIVKTVSVLDIHVVINWATIEKGLFSTEDADRVVSSQFRSFEFLPYVALWLHNHMNPPAQVVDISGLVEDPPFTVWLVDCFGNCKTTLTLNDLKKVRKLLYERFASSSDKLPDSPSLGDLPVYPQLKNVPRGTAAWVTGSSGFGTARFLELVVKGGDAAWHLNVMPGSELFPPFSPGT